MPITICVTGHIDLKDPKKVKSEIIYFLRYIKETNPGSELKALSAMAAGADTIFAQAVVEAKIPLKIVLPFQIEDYQKDFKNGYWKDTNKIISQNDYQINETIEYDNLESRNKAYLNTGKRLVDESNIVLAIWDGKEASGIGGTGDIVKYVQQNSSKELHVIKAAQNNKNEEHNLLDDAQELFEVIDTKAINKKKYQFNLIWITGIVFGLLGVLIFFYKILFKHDSNFEFLLSTSEFILVVVSVILINIFTNKGKVKFLTLRRDAEYLRSIITFIDAGLPIPKIDIEEYNPSIAIIDLETQFKIQSRHTTSFENSKRSIWSLIVQQIDYQTLKRKVQVEKKLTIITKWLTIIKWLFLSLFSINFMFEVGHHLHYSLEHFDYENIKDIIHFILSILPPIYAAFEGVKFFGEYNKDLKIIDETVKELVSLEKEVVGCKNSKNLEDISIELRKTLEKENIDWATRLKEKHIEKGA